MINLYQTFVAVVETGSISEAGRRIGQPKSAVSRHIEQLEKHLGVRLLQRSTRVVRPTDVGQEYYRRCVRILAEVQDAEQFARQDQLKPSGKLRVQVPMELGLYFFGRLLAEYARDNPQISLELELSNRHSDMIEEQYDLAIRVGAMPDSSLISRKILSIHYGFFASPAYLASRGEPVSLDDLRSHSCLKFQTDYISGDWVVTGGNVKATFRPAGAVTVNSLTVLREAAICDLGIAMLPSMFCKDALTRGLLKPVLHEWVAEDSEVFILYPSRQHLSMKVKGFLAFIEKRLEQISVWMNTPVEPLAPAFMEKQVVQEAEARERKTSGNGRGDKQQSNSVVKK